MEDSKLNLTDLSEEELSHISNVLSRDKKLQENQNFIKITVNNNNYEFNRKQQVSANDLVSAEIDRVKRLTPLSEKSGASSPTSGNSDTEAASHAEEGFFKSFAEMISRKVGSMDFSSGSKEQVGAINALAGSIIKMDPLPKVPFNYNPRESAKRKPTLLELASAKRSASPESPSVFKFDSPRSTVAMTQYRQSRGNSMFFSEPSSSTIPRNFKSTTLTGFLASGTNSMRPRSPSLPKDIRPASPAKFFRKSPLPSPKFMTKNKNSNTSPEKKETTISPRKHPDLKHNFSTNSEGFEISPSPEKKSSHEAKKPSTDCAIPTFSYAITRSSPDLHKIPGQSQVTSSKQGPISTQSNDSGYYPKLENFSRKEDDESLLEDDIDIDQFIDYEPDTESVYDTDFRRFNDFSDGVSIASACSSHHGSPMRRYIYENVPDSLDESDASSGVFVGNLGQSNRQTRHSAHPIRRFSPAHGNKPRWIKGNRRDNSHSRNASAGSDNAFMLSTTSSPSLSAKSLSLPRMCSPAHKRDLSPSPTKAEHGDAIGNLEISVVYYSGDCLKRKKMEKIEIPSYGTKSTTIKNCHVLSRKEYKDVTNAYMTVTDDTPSGCPDSSYGELHVTINGAKFQDHLGKIKAPNTYVKCYLLPDKFHNSKMKSSVIKKSKEPRWEHTFILAGFSQTELRERSLEIIVGSGHFKKQEVLGGAILSVGHGGPKHPWINSTAAESYIWKTALQISGNKVKALLPLRANMKPTYV